MDAQHPRLFDLINRLYTAVKEAKGAAATEQALQELIAYTQTHFADEERLMQQHGYTEFSAHKPIHEKLIAQVLEFEREFKAGRAGLNMELMEFLKDWLTEHILKTDVKYGRELCRKGVR